tara:strand:- start:21 stop:959 length:939 start_codon:yes stop_codon:yes gene_type:complete
MKINPIDILLNNDFFPSKKFYFISGNEITLIEKIRSRIVKRYKEVENASLQNIDKINNFKNETSLFEEKKIFICNNCKDINKDNLEGIRGVEGIFIFIHENSPKIKLVKLLFEKEKDSYLIDCYELDRSTKKRLLDNFFRVNELNVNQDIYWWLVEELDNKYIFFENSINKILDLDEKEITFENIRKILSFNDYGKEKVFFNLLKQNKEIIKIYRKKIVNAPDVSEFYYYCKYFCQLIIDCENESDYIKKIPRYLFREKNFLIDLYRKFNFKKKKLLLNLLSKMEKSLREQSNLSLISGLRFFLNIKKITIS